MRVAAVAPAPSKTANISTQEKTTLVKPTLIRRQQQQFLPVNITMFIIIVNQFITKKTFRIRTQSLKTTTSNIK